LGNQQLAESPGSERRFDKTKVSAIEVQAVQTTRRWTRILD